MGWKRGYLSELAEGTVSCEGTYTFDGAVTYGATINIDGTVVALF